MVGLTAPLSISAFLSKLDKLTGTADGLSPRDLLGAYGLDAALLLLFGGACVVLLGRVRGRWRLPVALILHLVAVVALLVSVLDHAFYRSQGEHLPGEMIRYGLSNAAMLRGVASSKLTPGIAAALGLALATPLLPAALSRLWPGRGVRRPTGWPLWAAWCGAVIAALGASRVPLSERVDHLRRNAVVALVSAAVAGEQEPGAPATAMSRPTRLEPQGDARPRLNLVFVILESARARSTTPYAPELRTTPFVAELARGGLRVERAYTPVPHTSKALISILCGRDPKLSTAIHEARPGGIPGPCLPELLAARGYATAFIQPAEEEFERRRGLVSNMGFATFVGKESLPEAGFEESSYFGYEDASILEPALAWVDQGRRPFFLTLLTLTAHHDYALPTGWDPIRFADAEPLNRYLNALAYTDRIVERLHGALARRGLLEETLFVFVGDHGEAFGEHGRWEHDNVLYEEGVHVPLILAGAGVEGPGVVEGLRRTNDILPTVAEILGYRTVGDRVSGRSLLSSGGHRTLYFSCWYARQCMALREGSRKTIFHYDNGTPEVFDLASDPRETRDLAGESAAARARVEDAIRRLKAWKRRSDAEYRAHFEELRAYAAPGGSP